VSRELERFRGRELETPGATVLATFDARREPCASPQALRDAGSALGLALRAGVHIGEVDARATTPDA